MRPSSLTSWRASFVVPGGGYVHNEAPAPERAQTPRAGTRRLTLQCPSLSLPLYSDGRRRVSYAWTRRAAVPSGSSRNLGRCATALPGSPSRRVTRTRRRARTQSVRRWSKDGWAPARQLRPAAIRERMGSATQLTKNTCGLDALVIPRSGRRTTRGA